MKLIYSNIFLNGKYVKFLLFDKGNILYIGNEKPKKHIDYNFEKYYIYPSFIDTHVHLLWYGLNLIHCDLNNVKNEDDIYSRLLKYYKDNTNLQYIVADGFDETIFNDKSFPQKKRLDELFPDIPVIVRRICGHIAVINENAYSLLKNNLDIYDKKTGIAKEGIILQLNTVFPPSDKEKQEAIKKAQYDFVSKGITTIGDMSTIDSIDIFNKFETDMDIFFYYPYYKEKELPKWRDKKHIKLKGLKIFLDGSIGAYSAANTFNYKNKKQNGILILKNNELKKIVNLANKKSYQLAIHAIGDRAIEQAIKHISYPHRIEHFELPLKKHIDSVKQKGILLSMQPNFIGNWSMSKGMYEKRLIKRYFNFNNPISYIYKKGIKLGMGSDCMPPSPIYGINSLKHAIFPEQKLNTIEGMQLYTKGSAEIMNLHDRGILRKGNIADFIVLDKSIAKCKNDKCILYTFKNGKIIYKRRNK